MSVSRRHYLGTIKFRNTLRPLNQKRSLTRVKQRRSLRARIQAAIRSVPGTVFVNGQFQRPYRYGYVSTPSGQFRLRVRFLCDAKVEVLGTGKRAMLWPGTDQIANFINPEK